MHTDGPTLSSLLERVLGRLSRGDAPDARWPDRSGEYWALCPFHPDRHAGSFSVSERGYCCFSCGAKGGLSALAAHLGLDPGAPFTAATRANMSPRPLGEGRVRADGGCPAPSSPTTAADPPPAEAEPTEQPPDSDPDPRPAPPSGSPAGLTLDAYASAKRLDASFLKKLGLQTVYLSRTPAVRIPYFDAARKVVSVRLRLALEGPLRFAWRRGSKPIPYGLWRLDQARSDGYLLLVEGESDCHTLWSCGIPALGLPGADSWTPDWAELLQGLTLYAWKEPDEGGSRFVRSIGQCLPELRVIAPPAGRKDASQCHVAGDDLPALVAQLRREAQPWAEFHAAERLAQAARAEAEAGALIDSPDLLAEFAALCRQMGLVGEERNAQILLLVLTSRLLERPACAVVKGPSGGGKSFLVETVLKAFPAEAYYALSAMSERSLAYSREPLAHRTLVLYEAAGLSGGMGVYLLRSLVTEGHIRYETVEHTPKGLVPRLIEREGPTGIILTTTSVSLDPELETRLVSLTVRDDPEQTRAVFRALAQRANGHAAKEADLAPWLALQKWLQLAAPQRVVVPYAALLAEESHPNAVRLRRDFGLVLCLVEAHALLHQRRRETLGDAIVATVDDYRAVHGLVADLVREGVLVAVSPAIRRTVEALVSLYHGTPVGLRALAASLEMDVSSVSRRVKAARRAGWILNLETRPSQPALLVPGDPLPQEVRVLPDPESLAGAPPPPCISLQI